MNKLLFDTLPEAKEFSAFAKSKGYTVSEPTKTKRPKTARKMYDLNGKPVTSRWEVIMGVRGAGKRGGKKSERKEISAEEKEVPGEKFHRSWDEIIEKIKKEDEQKDKDKTEEGKPEEKFHRSWDKLMEEYK